jgi:phosphomannomutase
VVITASHNPSIYNGFKYKPEYAGSASPEVVAKLESRIDNVFAGQDKVKRLRFEDALAQGVIEYIDPDPAYFAQLARLVDLETIRSAGLKIAVDSMYGAGAGYFRRLLGGAATQIIEIHSERNPLFPGLSPEPIARNLGALSEAVRANGAAVGLATDGDSDRIGIVDEHGNYVTQLQVFALLALYLLEVRGDRGALVKSLTTTSMAYRLGELFGVPVIETAVGFKYVGPQMIKHNALLGGEESGGFGFRGHIPERDALVAGLYFLDLMIKMKRTPSQLIEYLYSKVGPHYYDRVDIEFPPEKRQAMVDRLTSTTPASIDGTAVKSIDRIDGFRFVLEDGSWLLIRFSGTEPILRIYTETTSPERVKELLEEGKRLAGF